MTDTKAALDALYRLVKALSDAHRRHPIMNVEDANIVRQALTAQAEVHPADDDVRKAVDVIKRYIKLNDAIFFPVESANILIRAATAPKTTDAEREKALEIIHHYYDHTRTIPLSGIRGIVRDWLIKNGGKAKPQGKGRKDDDVFTHPALRAPAAVPRDAIETELLKAKYEIEDAGPKAFKYAGQHIDEALALLQQKGGE